MNNYDIDQQLQETKQGLTFLLEVLGERSRSIFRYQGFRPKHQQISRFHITTMSQNKWGREKKSYNNIIFQFEHGTFVPLVFSIHGRMGREWTKFYSNLAGLLFDKRKESKLVTDWVMLWFIKVLFTVFPRQ